MLKKLVSCVLVCSLILVYLCSCSSNQEEQGNGKLQKFSNTTLDFFDTACMVVGYEETQEQFDAVFKKVTDQLRVYNDLYDIYKTYEGINNIRTINQNAGKEPVKVDKKIIDMLDYSIGLYEKTDGMMNVAMGSVLSIWHDYRNMYKGDQGAENAVLPPMDMLKEAAKHTDIKNLVIDRENSTVFLSDPLMSLDVGAVAKGYATEMIAQSLIADGVNHYALSFGGNLRTIGSKGDGSSWSTVVTNPDLSQRIDKPYVMMVELKDQSFVTSGSYERFYTVDGKPYHHIIDPTTLMPNDTFTSISILCEDSGLADVLSTATFNLSYENGKKLIESFENVEAVWITSDNKILYSDGFEDIIIEKY